MNNISNRVLIISRFNHNIKFNLVRFGAAKFGFVCEQTGRRMLIEWPTRLDAAVGIASRYFTCQSHKDCAFANPKSVAVAAGLDIAFDLLLAAGFVKLERDGKNLRAVIV